MVTTTSTLRSNHPQRPSRKHQKTHQVSNPFRSEKFLPKNTHAVHMHHFSLHKVFQASAVIQYLDLTESLYLVLREDSSMEVWSGETCLKRVPGRPNAMVRRALMLQGFGNHVVTVGLDGCIRVWYLPTFSIVYQTQSFGGAIWDAVAVNRTDLLVACDDGKARRISLVNDFNAAGWDARLVSTYTPTMINGESSEAKRLLAVAYSRDEHKVLCAGRQGVYCFDLESAVLNFHTSSNGLVWAIEPLDNSQFAISDSDGCVSICESRYGTILHQFKKHLHDVTDLHAFRVPHQKNLSLASVGIDGQVVLYAQVSPTRWHYERNKRPSAHDLRCVHSVRAKPGMLVLGGVEGKIFAFPTDQKKHLLAGGHRIDLVSRNAMSSCNKKGILAIHDNQNNIYIMYTPISSGKKVKQSIYYTSSFEYKPSFVLKLTIKSKAGWNISSIALSPNGHRLVVTTPDLIEVIHLKHDRDNHKCEVLSRINLREKGIEPGFHVRFPRKDLIAIMDRSNTVQFYDVEKEKRLPVTLETGHHVLRKLQKHSDFYPSDTDRKANSMLMKAVHFMETNTEFIVIAYPHVCDVYRLKDILAQKSKPYWTIPFPKGMIHTLSINDELLHIVGTKYTFSVYSLRNRQVKHDVMSLQLAFDHDNQSLLKGPRLEVGPRTRNPGAVKHVIALKNGNYLLATHKEFFMLDLKKMKTKHLVVDEKNSLCSILGVEEIGDRQYAVCTLASLEQKYELPQVVYRKRFGAA